MIHVDTINRYLTDNDRKPNEGYLLRDKGSGSYIAEWNIKGLPKPTRTVLKPYSTIVENERALEAVRSKRKRSYKPIGDQLDAIMKWLATENEFSVPEELKSLAMHAMSVKAKYPKP
jgi:hypothetical protein